MADVVQLVRQHAERSPSAVAILAPGRAPLTYGGLLRQVEHIVATLNSFGVGLGDRVAMVLPDGPELAAALVAIGAGATCAPLNPVYRASEFEWALEDIRAAALVAPAGCASPAVEVAGSRGIAVLELSVAPGTEAGTFALAGEERRPPARPGFAGPDDLLLVLHTSGTAARPKLVPLTHRNVVASARDIAAVLELTDRDRCLNVMPLFHIHGQSTVWSSLAAGASVVCTRGFAAAEFLDWLEEFQPSWYTAAPSIHRMVLAEALSHPEAAAHSTLRLIRSASSAMPRQLIADMERAFGVPFVEAYGMTEAAPQVASNRLPPCARKPGSVGRAAGPEVAIMDEAGNLMPPGGSGEVVVRGANVMTGYDTGHGSDESAFTRGWLRTGDTGHLDAEGDLFITGRLKEVIDRGGEKISPREVDEVLMAHPAVAEAMAFPVPHPTLGESVAAAVVLREGARATVQEIRLFASGRLARFKLPQPIVIAAAIPTGRSGKPQRIGLAERLGLTESHAAMEVDAPRTPVEEKLGGILAGVLGLPRVGIHDNFFQLGGDSLTATMAAARIAEELQVDLQVQELFERPTVAELADAVAMFVPGEGPPAIPRRHSGDPCPLSFAQQRLWFLDQVEPGNPAYTMQAALRLTGPLDPSALEASLGEIRRRHEALRTTFTAIGGQPVQVIEPATPLRLPMLDLSRLPRAERLGEARRVAAEQAREPFNLARGPLFRAVLARLDPSEHVLILTMHHIVSDGWSNTVLFAELATLYRAYATGQAPPLPELPIQYADFAAWQRRSAEAARSLEAQVGYWREHLRDVPPVLDLALDRRRPALQTWRGARHELLIPDSLTGRLAAVGEHEGATLFMTVLAAFQALLWRYARQERFIVGTPIANRTRTATEKLIGFFANTLALRADLSGDPSFRTLLGRVRATALGAYAHQDLPFEKLVAELQPARLPDRAPLFQVMFAFQGSTEPPGEFAKGLTVERLPLDNETAKFDLTLYLSRTARGLDSAWQYNTDLFEPGTIERMADHFRTLLDGIVAHPDRRLSGLSLVSDAERRQLLAAGCDTGIPVADQRFQELFEAQVARTPDAVAAQCGDERVTYRALNGRANRLAHRLRQVGVRDETLVAVCLPRSVNMPVALLGVLKAGGACVPLDPEYPADRLAFMLEGARAPVLVTDERLRSRLPAHGAAVVCLEPGPDTSVRDADRDPAPLGTPASLAYVIYTSGSTGAPKGVMITHANTCHYVRAMQAALAITSGDRYLHTASFAFSSSMRQFLLPLSCGATVVLATTDEVRDPLALFQSVRGQGVSIIDVVPSYLRAATRMLAGMEAGDRAALLDNQLRLILSASETLHSDLPEQWTASFRHPARLVNMYGQTETTGIVTIFPITSPADGAARPVPLGRPIARTRVYVLDAARELVPPGVPGEVFIGGPGVGRGYLDEAATAERFVPDPFGAAPGGRLYWTGDLARIRPDGNLEFLGRVDQQVKVRGFRIEPGEIEAALNAHPQVLGSAVVAQDAGAGGKRLVAYVVQRPGEPPAHDAAARQSFAKALRDFLKGKLPDYMAPGAIVTLPALPMTPNGKVDRKALRAMDGAPPESQEAFVAPGLPAEEILAAIWADMLRLDRVGVDDNFFDLGGDSILGLEMIERANLAGLPLSPPQLFQYQTIAELVRVAVPQPVTPEPPQAFRPEQPGAMLPGGPPPGAATGAGASAVRVTLESMRAFGREALERVGLSAADAAAMTEVQIEASLRGQPTHNVGAIPRYARRIASGATNPRPRIRIERETATSALVDGDNGPGQLVAVMAMELAIRKARTAGVCVVGARRSNHFGAAGHYAWLAARENLIGLCTTNSALWLAPTGGVTPLFGTNPLGVGIPSARHHPIVLDVSMSVTAKGKVALHLAEGKPLTAGWILDRLGRPSIDAADLAAGLGVPIGGHKGYGLVLVLEVLAGVLTGAGFGEDHRRERMRRPDVPADFGHFFLAIDPGLFMPLAEFTARVDRMIAQVKAATPAEHVEEVLLPGESELRARDRNQGDGVPILPAAWRALQEHKEGVGLETDLVVVPEGLPFTRADIEQTIPARFEAVARQFAGRLALTGGGRRWTYRELNGQANRIAHAIRERTPRGVGSVAYLLGQSPEMVIATLSVLKAGKTYMAIHPRMPLEAQAEIMRDIAPELLLTTADLEPRARELAAGACDVLTLAAIDERYPDDDPPVVTRPEDPSTIFYTSGTTRQAKGVVKSHRAVLHRVWLSTQYDAITPADRQSLLTHCSFSASESDMFGALLQGASVHVFDIVSKGLAAFGEWLEEEGLTLLHPPVLFFRRFLATLEGEALFPSVRIVALAGDVVLPADLQAWQRHFSPSCILLHRFSITETALLTVARFDHRTAIDRDFVDAGRPVPDKALVLVNDAGEPVACGETGELVVRSAYLADGYWRRPAETAAAFRTVDATAGERAYHTGDLGRFLDDGCFVFLGRQDHQVKIRGYRVDTREVEAALLQLDDVAEAAVVAKRQDGEARLVAFVVPKPGARWDPVALRTRLRAQLPEWKVPARFEAVAALPATATGKVDRQRLVALAGQADR